MHIDQPYREYLDIIHSKLQILCLTVAYSTFFLLTMRYPTANVRKRGKNSKNFHFMAELRAVSVFRCLFEKAHSSSKRQFHCLP